MAEEEGEEMEVWTFAEKCIIAIGTAGMIGNASSLLYNCRRKGFPRRLYNVLNIIDFSVCIIGIISQSIPITFKNGESNYKDLIVLINYYAFANQSSALWTCIMSGTRLLAMSQPFYQINKPLFWKISTAILAFSIIPQIVITNLNDIEDLDSFQMRNIWIYLGCTSAITVVNLMITVWTCILLNRKSEVSAETDRHRKNATVTAVLLCVVFLVTNISGLFVCAIFIAEGSVTSPEAISDSWFYAWLLLMVTNAALNPVVILRRRLMDLCCRVGHISTRVNRISTVVTTN